MRKSKVLIAGLAASMALTACAIADIFTYGRIAGKNVATQN